MHSIVPAKHCTAPHRACLRLLCSWLLLQVEVPVGASVHKKVSYSNPYQQQRSLVLSTNLPGVLSFQPQHVDLTPGGSHPIGMVFSGPAAAAAAGVAPGAAAAGQQLELFVFLNDVDERGEECWRVVVRLV